MKTFLDWLATAILVTTAATVFILIVSAIAYVTAMAYIAYGAKSLICWSVIPIAMIVVWAFERKLKN